MPPLEFKHGFTKNEGLLAYTKQARVCRLGPDGVTMRGLLRAVVRLGRPVELRSF